MLTVLPKQEAEAAAVRRCSTKQVFLKKSVKSKKKTCVEVFFLIKLSLTLLQKRLQHTIFR